MKKAVKDRLLRGYREDVHTGAILVPTRLMTCMRPSFGDFVIGIGFGTWLYWHFCEMELVEGV